MTRSRPPLIAAAWLAAFGLAGCAAAGSTTFTQSQTPAVRKLTGQLDIDAGTDAPRRDGR